MGLLSYWQGGLTLAASPGAALPHGIGGSFFWGYVAFSGGWQVFRQYLELCQLRKNKETEMPKAVKALGIENKQFLESQAYQKDRRTFSMLCSWVNFTCNNLCLVFTSPAAWKFCARICGAENECRTTLLWMLITSWVDKPLSIAESAYRTFVIEEKHGFNKMTPRLFVTDLVKSEVLTYLFMVPLIPGLIKLVRWGGKSFYLYVWGASQTLIFAFMWIYPNFIQPLFNKFEPLQDSELRGKIEDLAATEEFPLTKLYQIDGSKRSSHSNAYFFGFWKNKRIVIFDTLLTLSHDQILAVLCHELGHWKFGHVTSSILISSGHLFILFWTFGQVMYTGETSQSIICSFGYGNSSAVMISLMTYTMLIEPVKQVLQLLMTLRTRANEIQADRFAVSKGRGDDLATGLLQMNQENKGDLNPDWLYAWYHFSHPALVERLQALPDVQKKLA